MAASTPSPAISSQTCQLCSCKNGMFSQSQQVNCTTISFVGKESKSIRIRCHLVPDMEKRKLLHLLLLGVVSIHTADSGEAAEFSYSGDNGPEKWGTLNPSFSACSNGKSQSPIDIPKQNVVSNPKLGPLSTTYNDASATLINNGFNVELLYENNVGHAVIGGKNYALKRIHWHSPSEHLIDGVSSAAELHLVHTSADGSISVIAILYKLGSPDPLLSQIKSEVDQLGKQAEGAKIPIQLVKIKDLMRNAEEKYFRYEGSLTSPPCTEKVIWNILTQVREISKEQVDAIKAPVDISSKNNARPAQPLNGRIVVSLS